MRSIYLVLAVSVAVVLAEPVYENTFCEFDINLYVIRTVTSTVTVISVALIFVIAIHHVRIV